jgi:putative DNA primase/helicase
MVTETYLEVIPENIPQQLKELKQWTVWKPVPKNGKKADKVPYSLQYNESTRKFGISKASVKDPNTLMTFEVALNVLKSDPIFKGLQFVLPSKGVAGNFPKIVGIDIDNAKLQNGDFDPEKLAEIKSLLTYVEKSPSGDGLRAFGFASFPEDEGVHADVEVYQYGKALTVTGHILDDVPTTVEPIQEALDMFRAKYFKPFPEIDSSELPLTSIKFADDELISKIEGSKSSDEFKDSFYTGASEDGDHSVKDFELCQMLVFWTQDIEQIDRIFRKSELCRPKWDEIHGHDKTWAITYGQMTINKALITRKTVYKPKIDLSRFKAEIGPYSVKEDGIYKTMNLKDCDPYEIRISSTPCIITAIGINIDTGELLYKLKIKDNLNHIKTFWKGTKGLMKRSDVLELLGDGMHFPESNVSDITYFFDKFITQHKEDLPTEIVASRCGWKKNFSMFIIGNYSVTESLFNFFWFTPFLG